MKKGEPEITTDDADAMLKKDALNRLSRLNKGGTLDNTERKRLRGVLKGARPKPKVENWDFPSPKPSDFEGQYRTRVRRMRLYVMRLQGYTVDEMCAELPAATDTVVRDLKAIDAALDKAFDKSLATRVLNQRLMEYEGLRDMALDAARSAVGNEHIGYLNTAGKMLELQTRLLQDAGILPKQTQRHEMTGPDGKPFTTAAPVMPPMIVNVNVTRSKDSDAARKAFGNS